MSRSGHARRRLMRFKPRFAPLAAAVALETRLIERPGVMTPTLAPDASPDQAQAFEATAELSRYFGGEPSIGTSATPTAPPRATPPPRIADVRRRGC